MADDKIILKAEDLDGYLTRQDKADLERLGAMYNEAEKSFDPLDEKKVIAHFDKMGHVMQEICASHPQIQVYFKAARCEYKPSGIHLLFSACL